MSYKTLNVSGRKGLYYVIGLRLFAVVLQLIAVWVGFRISDAFSGNCGDTHPSILPAFLVFIIGLSAALYGTISVFKARRYWLGIVSILLAITSTIIGLYALFVASFQLCF